MLNLLSRLGETYRATRELTGRLHSELFPADKAPSLDRPSWYRTLSPASMGKPRRIDGKPDWRHTPNQVPWFDLPTALGSVERWRRERSISDEDAQLLQTWVRDGYIVLDGYVDERALDRMNSALDGIWDAPAPIADVKMHGWLDGASVDLTHEELMALAPERKAQLKQAGWRFYSAQNWCSGAKEIFDSPRLRGLASLIFDSPAMAFSSLNFIYGSRQSLHQDMAVFHIHPNNYLIGMWIAAEDVAADAGPLILCPGSHREPLAPEFWEYPQTNLRTVDAESTARNQSYVDRLAQKYPRKPFLARKGQILLWHGMLIHGGEYIVAPGRTRRSMVIHYTTELANRHHEIQGPFRF